MTVELKRRTILLEGGPLDGRGYYFDDFDQLCRAEAHFGRTMVARYTDTGRREVHPQTGGSRGGQDSERWAYASPEHLEERQAVPAPAPEPEPPPDVIEDKEAAIRSFLNMAGAKGMTVGDIGRAMRCGTPASVAPLVHQMYVDGQLERSPQTMDPHYRIKRA